MVRDLKLNSIKEWKEWSKSGQRPANIPSHPDQVYRDAGWVNTADWLGYDWKQKLAARGKPKQSDNNDDEGQGDQDSDGDDDNCCSICLDPLDDTAHALHDNHRFHPACLNDWISECANSRGAMSNREGYLVTCPLCNKEVRCKRIRTA